MTPVPTPTLLLPVPASVWGSHDVYDWTKDIVLPAFGIMATIFVAVVAVIVSIRLGRRGEERAERQARAAFAAVARRFLSGTATDEDLRAAATTSASQEGRDLIIPLKLAREYLDFLAEKAPAVAARESEPFSGLVEAWVHRPAAARRNLQDLIDQERRWITFDRDLGAIFEEDRTPVGPDDAPWKMRKAPSSGERGA